MSTERKSRVISLQRHGLVVGDLLVVHGEGPYVVEEEARDLLRIRPASWLEAKARELRARVLGRGYGRAK